MVSWPTKWYQLSLLFVGLISSKMLTFSNPRTMQFAVILYGEVNEKTSNAKLEILGIVSDISKGITGPPSLSDPSLYNCFLFAFMNAFKFFSD